MPVGKLNQERVREVATQEKAERNSNTFFQFKDGKNLVRVLPPPPGSEDVFFKTATHWGVGPNKENFNCPAASDKNADCYLCDTSYKLSKSKSSDDQEAADRIRSKKQWLYNIVDLSDVDAGLQVMAVGITIHEKIRAYLEDEEGEYGDITDLEEGYDIRITREGTGNKTKYATEAKRKPSPVPPEILVLLETESPVDLSTVRPVATVEKQKAAYEGIDEEEEDDEEEEKTVRRRPAKAAKPVVEDDDDDDDDEDEAPAPKKGKAAPAPVVEDDDDEDEDDEDEDDAPAPKKTLGTRLGKKASRR